MVQSDMLETILGCLKTVEPPQVETAKFLRLLEECREEFYRIEDALDAPLPHLERV